MRWIGVAAAVAVLAFVAAGCGGSSDSNSEAAGDTAVTETSSTTDTSTTTDTTEDTSTSTDTTEATSTDTSGNLAGLSGDCKDLAAAGQKFGAAIASSANGGNSDLQVTADAFKEFVAQAPDELKDDFQVLAKVITVYAAALKDIDFKAGSTPTPAQIAKLTKLGQSLNSADVQKASAAISAWSKSHCGATP